MSVEFENVEKKTLVIRLVICQNNTCKIIFLSTS